MNATALLVIDMINPYDHKDADQLTASVQAMIEPLKGLLDWARGSDDVRVVYVNDNYGDFSATRHDLLVRALDGHRPDLVEPIAPSDDCAFLSKVRHSAFYATPLEYLLQRQHVTNVILTGQVTEQCILYTALDAYVRHLMIKVPTDAVAHIDPGLCEAAQHMMKRNMRAQLVTSQSCLD